MHIFCIILYTSENSEQNIKIYSKFQYTIKLNPHFFKEQSQAIPCMLWIVPVLYDI